MRHFKKIGMIFLILLGIGFIFQATNGISAFTTTPPDHYSSLLTADTTYNYQVIEFNGPVYWWTEDKYLYTNQSGEISITLLGFADQPAVFRASNLNPVPFCNITSKYLDDGVLKKNVTLVNKSTTEIGSMLVLSYNDYIPGFITSVNWTHEKLLATNSVDPTGWVPGTVTFDESNPSQIKMVFKQAPVSGNQNTTLIYNKETGVLIYAKTEIFFFNLYSLEIQLKEGNIPGYPIEIFGLLSIIAVTAIVLVKKKNIFNTK